jgi:O-antigen ligase
MTSWEEEGGEPGVVPHRDFVWHSRRLADRAVVGIFFALVLLAALPMGANRDWAWAPLCVMFGLVSILVALGLGARTGFRVAAAERTPLLALIACFVSFVAFALWQMLISAPASGGGWLFMRAAEVLGHAHAPIPAVAADEARNSLLRCLACVLIFLMARAVCRDPAIARWFLILLVASGIIVVGYGLLMHVTTHSCYVGTYLRKQYEYIPAYSYCLMAGTFVSSNSFACYVGMAMVAAIALVFSDAGSPYGFDEIEGEGLMARLTGARVAMIASAILLLGGLLFSASRAGFAATVAGAFLLGLLLMRGQWKSRPDLGRIFVIGLVTVIVVGTIAGGALINKAAAGGDGGTRVQIWLAALQAIELSPWLGWGLGGFGDIYTILQPASILQPNDIAHSTPLETVVELGVLAALPAFGVVLLPWGVCLRGALRRRPDRRYLPAAAFAVSAVAILHSAVDFSLQIPAIGFVVSASLGMGWAQAFGRRDRMPNDFASAA